MRLISKGKAIGLHEHDGLILSRSRCKPRDAKLRFSVDGDGLVACFDSETPTQIRPLGTELEVNGIGPGGGDFLTHSRVVSCASAVFRYSQLPDQSAPRG